MTTFTITDFFPDTECDLTGKNAEAVQVTTDDGAFRSSIISFAELKKQIRQRYLQEQRQNGRAANAAANNVFNGETDDQTSKHGQLN